MLPEAATNMQPRITQLQLAARNAFLQFEISLRNRPIVAGSLRDRKDKALKLRSYLQTGKVKCL
jgi:hypothetical protein